MKSFNRKSLHERRKIRIRKKINGCATIPRLSVFRSSKHIYVQAIDDSSGLTLASASTLEKDMQLELKDIKKVTAAVRIGSILGKRLHDKGITSAVFDRNGHRYKGRIAALALGVRETGLKI